VVYIIAFGDALTQSVILTSLCINTFLLVYNFLTLKGPLLAGFLSWPQVTYAANLTADDSGGITVERETDSGTETIKIPSLPAVVTCDLRLNEPRYATLPNIMKAKKKKIDTINANDLGVDLTTYNEVVEVFEPPPRKEGVMVESVDELLVKMREEAGVIP